MPENIVIDDSKNIVIDDSNFDQYFFDVRKHQPKQGDVMAVFTATAELVDGDLKRQMIDVLSEDFGAETAVQLMRKLGGATEKDALRVVSELTKDLLSGKIIDEVAEKPYPFQFQQFYYTKKEHIPNNKHWFSASLIDVRYENLEEVLEKIDG